MNWVDHWVKFVRGHTALLAICGAVFLVWNVGSHWIDRTADRAIADAASKVEAAKAQANANQQLAQAAQAQADKYRDLVATLSAQNAAIANAIAQRNAATVQRQEQVKIEPLPEVATRWQTLLSLSADDITGEGAFLRVSEPGARSTVIALEAGEACTANLSDTEQRCTNDEQRIAACEQTTQTCEAQVGGLQAQIVTDKQASDAEVKAVKATARRGKIQWFERGLAGGGIGAVLILGALGVL